MVRLSIAGILVSVGSVTVAQNSSAPPASASLQITHAQKTTTGSPENFTGLVQIETLFTAQAPARSAGARVMFAAGARSVWHTHPLGQVLIITSGEGRVQAEGSPVQVVHAGDVICIPPGVRHWHRASPDAAMTHIAIQEAQDGKVVDWMEPVTDAQYLSNGPAKSTH